MAKGYISRDYATVNGGEIYYEVAGEGEAIILLHGLFLDSRMWDHQFETLSKTNKVIRVDLRGFGKTMITEDPFSNSDDLKGIFEHLNIENAHIVGLSFGAIVALEFTITYPEFVKSLTLCSLNLNRDVSQELKEARGEMFGAFQNGEIEKCATISEKIWLNGISSPVEITDEDHTLYRTVTIDNLNKPRIKSNPIFMKNIAERIEEVSVPTLILFGRSDFEDYQNFANVLEHSIKNSRKLAFANSAHMINISEPDLFTKTIESFVNKKQ
ncbi:Pimeloyl-ACP methyl ester carboxylesterase [Oceanobacillus limi]|uniref:Pimeloyl-ACP methyl ester carboxylesterase n=1 Tax=Oceanobacillus limi TaxID=930131 RepID=A0A1H9Y233_9BACI|nr:alpha/beta hydrolase [Oceanobacillus limi]SES62353.1 Pimeloyl-ACP methyl ester carboxylesterase [Oceanobacillus limi]